MTFWITEDLGTVGIEDFIDPLLPSEHGVLIFDVRDIKDGKNDTPEHPLERVVAKFNALVSVYYCNRISGFKTAVRCTLGISRSNAFAAGLIAHYQEISYEDALNVVKSKVFRANPNMDIIDDVKYALAHLNKS